MEDEHSPKSQKSQIRFKLLHSFRLGVCLYLIDHCLWHYFHFTQPNNSQGSDRIPRSLDLVFVDSLPRGFPARNLSRSLDSTPSSPTIGRSLSGGGYMPSPPSSRRAGGETDGE